MCLPFVGSGIRYLVIMIINDYERAKLKDVLGSIFKSGGVMEITALRDFVARNPPMAI